MTKIATTPSQAWRDTTTRQRVYIDRDATFAADARLELAELPEVYAVALVAKASTDQPVSCSNVATVTLNAADVVRLWQDLGDIMLRNGWAAAK